MARNKDARAKLIGLETESDKDKGFMVEMCEDISKLAGEGGIKQLVIVWEDAQGDLHVSRCSRSRWALIGMMEFAKVRTIMKGDDET